VTVTVNSGEQNLQRWCIRGTGVRISLQKPWYEWELRFARMPHQGGSGQLPSNRPDKRSGKWSELMDIALLGPFGDNIKEMAA
jgi:hypothetical protein